MILRLLSPVSLRKLSISIIIVEKLLKILILRNNSYILYLVAENGMTDNNQIFLQFPCINSNCDILPKSILFLIISITIDLSGVLYKLCRLGITTSRIRLSFTWIFLSDGIVETVSIK